MSNKHEETRMVVHVVLTKASGEILLTRRCNTGYCNGMYQVPTSRIKNGELPMDAVMRLVRDRFGIALSVMNLFLVHHIVRIQRGNVNDRSVSSIDFYFKGSDWKGEAANLMPQKCDDMRWVYPYELPENTIEYMKLDLRSYHEKIFYVETRRDWSRISLSHPPPHKPKK